MIKSLLAFRKYLVLGVLLLLSFSDAFAQVDLELNARSYITKPIDPAPGLTTQYCITDDSSDDLTFQVKNIRSTALSLTTSSLLVTLTVSGNTFFGGTSTVVTRVFTTGTGGVNTISSPVATSFDWDDVLRFQNSGPTVVTISVAASATTDVDLTNQTQTISLDILPNPTRPVLNTNKGTTPRICQGEALTITAAGPVGPNITYEFYRTNGGSRSIIRSRQASNFMTTTGLNNGDAINVTAYLTNGNCTSQDTGPINIVVDVNPIGSISSDKGNDVACPGDVVVLTAANANFSGTAIYEFYLGAVTKKASTTAGDTYTTDSITQDNLVYTVRTWNSATATLCYDEENITIRLNSLSGANVISNSATSVCDGITPPVFSSDSVFASDRSGEGGTVEHQWQSSTIGGAFGNVTPASAGTSASYAPSALTTTTLFRRLTYARFLGVKCISTIASATSNIVTLTYQPAVNSVLLSNTTNRTLCADDDLVLDASSSSNALSYAFYRNSIIIGSVSAVDSKTIDKSLLSDTDTITLVAYAGSLGSGCSVESTFVLRINSFTGANTISNSVNACFGEVPTPFTSISTPTFTAGATITYQWQSRIGTDPFVDILAPLGTQEVLSPSAIISSTTDFQRLITSELNGLSCTDISNPVTISVIPAPTGTLVANDTACLGEDVIFTASGGDMYEFFENSISLGASSNVNTRSISGLANLNSIKVEVTDTSSCTAFSNTITMTILAVPNASISSGVALDIVCSGEYPTFTAGPVVAGYTYQFFVNNSLQTTGVTANSFDSNAVSNTLVLGTSNVISVNVSNGICTDTDSLTLVVNSLTGANTISASQTICSGGTPATLSSLSIPTADSAVATIGYQWQNRETGTTFSNIPGALSVNYSPSAISTTTFYRRLVFSHLNSIICPSSNDLAASNVVTVTVDTNAVPVISFNSGLPSNVMCAGDFVTFDASGTTGAGTYQYFINGSPVLGPTTANTFTPNAATLGTINDFSVVTVRAISTVNSLCFVEQSIIMRLNEQSVANTIQASQTICNGTTPALLTGSSVTGTPTITYQWQAKSGTNTFTNISLANNVTYQPSGLATTTVFRRNVISTLSSVTCIVSSDAVTITVIAGTNPVARLTSNRTGAHVACSGELFTFDASTSTGGLSYQFFVDGASQGVASAAATTIVTLAKVTSTIRVDVFPLVNGGGCPSSVSIIATVNSIVGTNRIGGVDTVCSGENPSVLSSLVTPTSATGTITYQWQSRTGTASFTNINLETGLSYDPPIPTATTGYIRLAQSTINGVICSIPSNVVTITLDANPIITGTLTSTLSSKSDTICFGSQDNITFGVAVAGTPTIAFYINDSVVQTSTSKTYTVSQTVFSNRDVVKTRVINAGGCFTEETLIISVNQTTAGSITGAQAVCAGATPFALTSTVSGTISGVTIVSPGTGNYQWENSVDNVNWNKILTATSDTYSPLANPPAALYYRRLTVNTLNGVECTQPTNSILVSVDALPIPGLQANAGAITAPATMTSCVSSTINFTGSGGIEYEFFVNDISIQARGVATTFSTNLLRDSEEVHVRVYKTAVASSCFDDSGDIEVTIEPLPAAAISATSITNNTFCTGDTVIFTAASGGVSATYDFKFNTTSYQNGNSNIFDTSSFPAITITDGSVFEVIVTTPSGCSSIASVTLVENAITDPGTLSSTKASICLNEIPAPIVGTAASGTGTITYRWQVASNGAYSPIGGAFSSTYTPTTSLSSTTYYQRITRSEFNGITCERLSTPFEVSVELLPANSLTGTSAASGTITASSALAICSGEEIRFVASGGTRYEFFDGAGISRKASSTSDTFTSTTLINNEIVYARVYNVAGCFSTTGSITIIERPLPNAGLTRAVGNTFCTGDTIAVQATSSIPGSFFEFRINNTIVVSSTTSVFTPTAAPYNRTLVGGDIIWVTVASPGGCSATQSLTLIENIIATPGALTTADTTICIGDIPPVLTGTLGTASGTILYQWQESLTNLPASFTNLGVASTTGTFTPTTAIVTTTYYRRQIQSRLNGITCDEVSGGSIMITVSAPPPGILTGTSVSSGTVTASSTLTICAGEEIRFVASGGASYEFFDEFGVSLRARLPSDTFTSTTLIDNDKVYAQVYTTATGGCFSTTDLITIIGGVVPNAGLTRAVGNTFCTGDTIAVQATSSIPGSFFEFRINNTIVVSSTTSVFTPTAAPYNRTLVGGDIIWVTVASPGGCSATQSLTLIENIIATPGALTTADTTICIGDIPPVLTGTLGTASGTILYQWQESLTNLPASFTNLGVASTTGTFTPTTAIVTTTYYRRQIQSRLNGITCDEVSGGSIMITVSAPPPGILTGTSVSSGTVTASSTLTICAGEEIRFVASGGASYEFFDEFGVSLRARLPSDTFTSTTLIDNDKVYAQVYTTATGGCFSTTDLITIIGGVVPTVRLTRALGTTFCSDDALMIEAIPSLPGYTYEFFIGGSTLGVSGVSSFTALVGGIDDGEEVSVIVTAPGGCSATTSITFIENKITTVGTLSTVSSTMCADTSASAIIGTASVVSGTRTEYEWYESPDNSFGSYTIITGANSTTYEPGNLDVTTYFKRRTISTLNGVPCDAYTPFQLINVTVVNPFLVVNPGAISATGTITVCNPLDAVFTGSGGLSYEFFINGIQRQARSTSAIFSSTLIANNDPVTVVVYDQLTAAGACSSESDEIIVLIPSSPTVNLRSNDTDNTFCTGDTIMFTANSSLDSSAVSPTYEFYIGPILYQTSTSTLFTPTTYVPNLNDSDRIRVVVANLTGCSATDSITLVENLFTVAGSIAHPDTTICDGSIPLPFTNLATTIASGVVSYTWESRITTTIFLPIPGANSITYTPTTVHNQDTFYRRKATSLLNFTSCDAYSNVVSITMNPVLVGGTISPTLVEICSGDRPGLLTVTGGSVGPGITYQWQISLDGTIYTDLATATGATYNPPILNAQTFYKRIVNIDGGAPPVNCSAESSFVQIDVLLLQAGVLDTSIALDYCYGAMPPRLSSAIIGGIVQDATSTGGAITYQWQESLNDVAWTTIVSATDNYYDPPSLIQTTWYRRVAISSSVSSTCDAFTDSVRIGILGELNAGNALGDQTICAIVTPLDLPTPITLATAEALSASVTYQWQLSSDQSMWSDITGEQAATLNFSIGGDGLVGTADDDNWLPTTPASYYRAVITYVGDPVPETQEQTSIVLSASIPVIPMVAGAYSISVNGNLHTVSTVAADTIDDLGFDLAAEITSNDPLVNATYNASTTIISLVPVVAGSYTVASSTALADDSVAVILPAGSSINMKVIVSGDNGTRTPNSNLATCQAYSNVVTIQVDEQPLLTLIGGTPSPQQACAGDPITPIEYLFTGPIDQIEIRNLDPGLTPVITGPGAVNPIAGFPGWWRLTGVTSATFSITGTVNNTTNFEIITILNPLSSCTQVRETYVILVTPDPVQPDFIRRDVNQAGYEVLSSAMSSIASVTAIAPVRWYNNTVCQDRLAGTTTAPIEFFACFTDNRFLSQFNVYEWDVSPASAGNMIDNNFQQTAIQLTTLSVPANAEVYTVSITTILGTLPYTTTTTAATQTTDEIGLDLARQITANAQYSAIYNNVLDQIIVEGAVANATFTTALSPITAAQSSQFSNQISQLITRSGTMNWNPAFAGQATVRVRSIGCGTTPSAWTSVVMDVVPEQVPALTISDLEVPIVLDAGICGGATTGAVPLCAVDAFTLPTQFFTSSINGANINDYGSLEWRFNPATISPGGPLVASPGTIDQATGIITWNQGWWGSFDLQVRPVKCNLVPTVVGDWSSTTVSIGPVSGPPTINTVTPLPQCPIPAAGFTSTLFSNQEVNWYVNSRVGLATTTTFVNTGTLQLTPLASNDLLLDFLPGFSGNVIITAESATCPDSTVNYVIQIPGPPIIALTSAPGTDFQRGASSVCVDAAITTITYDISGAADLVSVIGLQTGITSVLSITPQSVNMTLGDVVANPFTVGQLYTVNIDNIIYSYTTVAGNDVDDVGAGLVTNINLNTTNFVATYAANVLSIDVSATGKRGDAFIIAPSTPVNNSFSIAAPLVTVLQKILTISGTANTTVAAGSYTYTVTTQAPVAGCAVASATGIIEIEEAATIQFATGRANNTGVNAVCIGASFTAPLTLATLRFNNAAGLAIDPLTPFPAGLSLSMSASGSFDEYEIVGTITEVVLVPTTFSVTIDTFGASCSEASIQIDIEVIPNSEITPVNSATVSQVVCSREAIIPIRFEVFNPAFGIGTTALSVFPDGVTGRLFQQLQVSEFEVENLFFPAVTLSNVSDTFSFNINNTVYNYEATASDNTLQLAANLTTFLTAQLPADFTVVNPAGTAIIRIEAVNAGFAFNIVSSVSSVQPRFLTISDTEIIDPPSYYEISGTPSVTLVAPADYVYVLTTAGPGCTGSDTMSGTITVQPNTYATYQSGDANPVICDNEVIGDIVYSYIGATGFAVVTPTTPAWLNVAFDPVAQLITISTPVAPNQNVTVTTVYNYEINLVGSMFFGCTATPSAIRGTITVSPLDQIAHVITSGAQNQDICVGGAPAIPFAIDPIEYQLSGGATNATVIGLPPGITANLTVSNTIRISGTATAIPSATFTYNYVLVTTPAACASATIGGAITVFSKPELTLVTTATSANQTGINSVCDTTAIQTIIYEHSSTIPITTQVVFTWVGSNTLNGLGVTAIVSGTNQFVVSGIPTTNVTETTIYNYQIETVGSNCTPELVLTGSIEINPIDTLSLISSPTSVNQFVCIGDQDNPLTAGTDSYVPIVYQLGGGATNATVVGLPLGLNYSISPSNTLVISGAINASATPTLYNYLITTMGDCTNVTAVGSIDVSALPTLTLTSSTTSANQTGLNYVCDATPIETIVYQLGGGATNFDFSWTGTLSNTIATSGLTYTNSGTTEFVISGTPTTAVTQTSIFEYQIATMGSNCIPEIVLTGRIQIEPNQTIDLISAAATENQIVCVNNQINPLGAVTSVFAPIEYQLGGSAIGATITGLPPGIGFSRTASNTILITGSATASATSIASPTVIYNYEINTFGDCDAALPITGSITVNSLPVLRLMTASSTANQTAPLGAVCVNTAIDDILYRFEGGATAVIFNWTSPYALAGLTATNSGTNEFVIFGAPSVTLTTTTIFNYEIITTGSNCAPEITLTGSIEVIPEDLIVLTSAAGTDNQNVCVSGLPVGKALTDIVYELRNGARTAIVTGLPPGIGYSINASRTLTISGAAQASSSLSSLTITNYVYTITSSGCSPDIVNGTISVTPPPEMVLVSGLENQPPVCNNTPITSVDYVFNPAAGALPTVAWPDGRPNGVIESFGGLTLNKVSIQGTPNVTVTSTTIYRYIITYSAICAPDVVQSGSIGVIPTPVINDVYIIANDVTNVTCFEGNDGSIIIPDAIKTEFEKRISGGLLSVKQVDEITLTGTPTIGDIITVSFGGKTYTYTVKASAFLSLIPEDFQVISNELADEINNAVAPNESYATAVPNGTPLIGGLRLTADVGGIALNTSVNVVQTTSVSNTLATTTANRGLNYNYNWTGPGGYSSSNLSIFNLLAGDYFLTVDLNGCAETSAAITVTEPPELVIVINACGGTTGSFEATITGGTPPYNLILEDDNGVQIGPAVVSNGGKVYTGLAVGDDYVLEVTDQTCLLAVREAIEIPTQLLFAHWDLNDGVTDSYCSTSTIGNGSIELTRPASGTFQSAFSGGSNVYSYQWTSSAASTTIATTPNIYNLVADIYTVTITDLILGCSDTKSFTVGGYPPLELNSPLVAGLQLNTSGLSSSTADYVYFLSCSGDNDVAFTFNATGGNSNYTITDDVPGRLNTPPPLITNIGGTFSISGGYPGFYIFTLDDKGPPGRSCPSVIKTVEVITPGKMRITENTTNRVNPVCFGDLGYLEFNIAGGAPNQGPYTVTLNGGQLSYTTLSAGDRQVIFADIDTSLISTIAPSVEIEDAFGCVATSLINSITFNITQELIFDTTVTDIDCSVPTPGSVIFNETGPGTFIDPRNVQIRIFSNPTIVPAINLFPAWGTNPAASGSIQLTQPGVYFYEITDGNTISCPAITGSFEIGVVGNTAPLDITSIDVTQVGCDNATSIIALNIQNIQPPLNISWFEYKATTVTGGTGTSTTATTTVDWIPLTSLDQNATVSNLPEGIYRAEVSDGRSGNCGGILRTKNILLQESSIQIVNFRTIENNPALCDNYGTGFTTDVLFSISENLNRNLGSNSFEITLLSKSGTVITNPTAWNLPKPQGFVYRYPNLPADQYTLSVTESLPPSSTLTACSEIYFFDIQDYLPITYIGQTVFETDICTGLVDEIEALASGGVPFIVNGLPSYQFEWTYTPIDPTQSPSKFFGQTLTNVPAGNYCVKITDANGCSYDSCDATAGATPLSIIVDDVVIPFSVTGNLPDPTDPSVLLKSLPPDCSSGGLDGRIGVVLSGGLLPYTINWFVEDPTSLTSTTNPGYRVLPGSENRTSLDGLLPGNYKMVVTSLNPAAAACATGGNFINNDYLYYDEIIQVTPNRELYIIDGPFVDADLCSGNYGRLEVEVFDNNNGNLSFYYNGILIPSSDVIRLNNYSWSVAIVNAIESADFKIVNEEGCWITTQINRGIGEPNFTYTSPNFAASSNVLAREEVTFTNASTDPYVVSEWIFGDNTPPILVETSTTSITPVRHAYGVSGTYFATLRIYNSIGCSEEISEPIAVGKGYNIMVPNVFTPNNDSVNDNFKALFSGFSNMTFSVYDYRGNVIYNEFIEEQDLTNIKGISIIGWDGSLAPYSPYYIFTASGVLLDGETVVEESGTFILIN
ncbi:gliding motility-associated C-terminal domain-containing protein [Flavobacteriaceae bacterium]|nr:gliding motility-associated C-terminal domain-containing protein [Flavobacteriaceae bacterium]